MVALFASLKWRLVTSRLRHLPAAKRGWMLVGLGVLLVALLAIGFLLTLLRQAPDVGYLAVTGLFSLQLVAWVLSPLVAFGVDETVDPQRFALLPLRPQTLQRGLLMSSLIGYLPIANVIVLIGAAIGLSVYGWMLPVALLCAALQLVTCMVFSRAAATSMASLMSSRRGRDLGMLVGFAVIVIYLLANLLLNSGNQAGIGIGSGAGRVARVLAWGPPGSLAALPAYLATGQWGRAAVAALIALVFLAVGWWWWSAALRKSLTTVDSQTEGSAPSHGLSGADAIGGTLGGTARVVAGRDLTLMWRDPMRRMPWLLALLMAVAWPLLVFRFHGAVFGCGLGALLFGAQAANMYGYEGSGLWLHLVAFADRQRARGEVLGHAIVVIVPSVVLVAIAVVLVAVVRHDGANIPAALGLCWSAIFGAVATGSYLSAVSPYAMPQSRKSMFASSVPGQKGLTFRSTFGTIIGGAVVAAPAIVCAVLSVAVAPVWGWVGLLISLVLPPLVLVAAIRMTAARFLQAGPSILAVVSVGDRS